MGSYIFPTQCHASFHNNSTYPENLLHAVCYRDRRDDHKIVKLLLKHALKKGIDVDTIDRYGRTPTHFAFGYEYDHLEVYNNDHTLSHDHNSEYPDPHPIVCLGESTKGRKPLSL